MRIPLVASAVLTTLVAVPARAQLVFLQNDSFTGGTLSCYHGVGNDGGLASKFTAQPSQYPYTIDRIRVLGCGTGSDAYVVQIFEDNGTGVNPGPVLWNSSNAYLLQGGTTFNDILMSAEPVPPPPITSGSVRVLLVNISILEPIGFGADTNGILPQRNFVRSKSSVWSFAESPPFNVQGDWVLRLGINEPAAQPSLSVLDVFVTEGNGGTTDAVFTVTLSPPSAQTVTVAFATADGTAQTPGDYESASGILTFPPGAGALTTTVRVAGDLLDEDDEDFSLTLANPTNATIQDGSGVGTITDDDATPSLTMADVDTTEGDGGTGILPFTVALSAPSGFPVTVNYATVNGSAIAPGDYAAASGTLTLAPGQAQRTIDVAIVRDLQDEGNETFLLNLTSPLHATISDGIALGLIRDDDALVQQELAHGTLWVGNLATHPGPAPDVDVYAIAQAPHASYEVLVDASSGDLGPFGPVLERFDPATSTVVQTSVPTGAGFGRALRWENASSSPITGQQIRLSSAKCSTDCGPDDVYRVRAYETTSRSPRFNNTGGQFTVIQLQNASDVVVTGTVWYWSGGGTLLDTQPIALAPWGSTAINTSSRPALVGQGGSLTVTSNAPYGALTGKAVSLEPANGLSFDALLEPRPR